MLRDKIAQDLIKTESNLYKLQERRLILTAQLAGVDEVIRLSNLKDEGDKNAGDTSKH